MVKIRYCGEGIGYLCFFFLEYCFCEDGEGRGCDGSQGLCNGVGAGPANTILSLGALPDSVTRAGGRVVLRLSAAVEGLPGRALGMDPWPTSLHHISDFVVYVRFTCVDETTWVDLAKALQIFHLLLVSHGPDVGHHRRKPIIMRTIDHLVLYLFSIMIYRRLVYQIYKWLPLLPVRAEPDLRKCYVIYSSRWELVSGAGGEVEDVFCHCIGVLHHRLDPVYGLPPRPRAVVLCAVRQHLQD